MTAVNTKRKIVTILMRSRCYFSGQNKPLLDVNGGVLFQGEESFE